MIRRALTAAVLTAGLLAVAAPAHATCTAGYVGLDKDTLKPRVELPRCEPPPTD